MTQEINTTPPPALEGVEAELRKRIPVPHRPPLLSSERAELHEALATAGANVIAADVFKLIDDLEAFREYTPALLSTLAGMRSEIERLREALGKALVEIESEPQCCGRGQPTVVGGNVVGEECCGCPEYGFERGAAVIRAALQTQERTNG